MLANAAEIAMNPEQSPKTETLLELNNLKIHFPLGGWHFFKPASYVYAVDDVSFKINKGKTFALVGESGSGKTTTAFGAMRLVNPTSGKILLENEDITRLEGIKLRRLRRKMQIIFQDPYSSLNPQQRAGAIVREPLDLTKIGSHREREERVSILFKNVGLRQEHRFYFPHQFSGGQRQRISIARAIATQPELIFCDEPVSALDVAIQAQILNLLRRLQDELKLTYLFISHDLGVVQYMCDEVAVMYLGRIVEQADRVDFFKNPVHPYTLALLSAIPSSSYGATCVKKRVHVKGDPPSPINPPPGCHFHGRCWRAEKRCRNEYPLLREISEGHRVACHLV